MSKNKLILGIGVTGMSCADFFKSKDIFFKIFDTRGKDYFIDYDFGDINPDSIYFKEYPVNFLNNIDEVIISPGLDKNHKIFKDIKKHNIDIVYSTSINERHQDHKNIGLSVLVAGRNIPKEVYQFETISTTNDFDPRMFKDISDVIEIKKQCIDQHKSQEHRTYIENYDVVNKWRSLKLGYPERYYESFEIIKLVK